VSPCPLCGDTATPRLTYHQGAPGTPDGVVHQNCVVCGRHWLEPWEPPPARACGWCGAETVRRMSVPAPEGWEPARGWQKGDAPLVLVPECEGCARTRAIAQLRARQENPAILDRVRVAEAAMLAEVGGRTAAAA